MEYKFEIAKRAVGSELYKSSYAVNSQATGMPLLMEFQRAGVEGIIARLNKYNAVLLGDDPGLGKTIQVCEAIKKFTYGVETRRYLENILIICPASLKLNWKYELKKWAGIDAQVIMRSSDTVAASVVIANYELVAKDSIKAQLHGLSPELIVFDEAHYIKNPKALRTKKLFSLLRASPYRIAMTGTPIQNKPIDLFPIIKGLYPDIIAPYTNYYDFARRYCGGKQGVFGFEAKGATNIEELNFKLRSTIMIRRDKASVLSELPEKTFQIITLQEAKKTVAKKYQTLNDLDIEKVKEKLGNGDVGEISKIRHELGLEKVQLSLGHIESLMEYKSKLVVFAYHTDVIAKLTEGLKHHGVVVFDGGTSIKAKDKAVSDFNNDPEVKIFIGQFQSAGVGITLTTADTVVFVESSWVPSEINQAVDRCHRIGQKNSVLAQFLTIEKSIDDTMLRAVVGKQNTIDRILM